MTDDSRGDPPPGGSVQDDSAQDGSAQDGSAQDDSAQPETQAITIAVSLDDWDVPTAASPIVARSVFPLESPPGPLMRVAPGDRLPHLAGQTPARDSTVPTQESTEPTQDATMPASLDASLEGVTEVYGVHAVGLAEPVDEGLEASAIDVLFGHSPARGFHAGNSPDIGSSARDSLPGRSRAATASTMPRTQKILIVVLGVLIAGLALVALFLLGMRIGQISAVTETTTAPTSKPSAIAPRASAAAVGPVAPGTYSWDELLGGECLTSYDSPWQDSYTVVECASPHRGQLMMKFALPDAIGAPYPTPAALESTIIGRCSAPTVVDYVAAGAFADMQLEVAYPADSSEWDAGDRTALCFASRAGGEDLTGSLTVLTAG